MYIDICLVLACLAFVSFLWAFLRFNKIIQQWNSNGLSFSMLSLYFLCVFVCVSVWSVYTCVLHSVWLFTEWNICWTPHLFVCLPLYMLICESPMSDWVCVCVFWVRKQLDDGDEAIDFGQKFMISMQIENSIQSNMKPKH